LFLGNEIDIKNSEEWITYRNLLLYWKTKVELRKKDSYYDPDLYYYKFNKHFKFFITKNKNADSPEILNRIEKSKTDSKLKKEPDKFIQNENNIEENQKLKESLIGVKFEKCIPVNKNEKLRKVFKINWIENNNSKLEIGQIGEIVVLNFELQKYKSIFVDDKWEENIEHSSVTIGDGLGYDIRSVNSKKEIIFIEVKSTTGKLTNPIYFTKNEINFLKSESKRYYLYRVFNINKTNKTGEIEIFKGGDYILNKFNFEANVWQAKLK